MDYHPDEDSIDLWVNHLDTGAHGKRHAQGSTAGTKISFGVAESEQEPASPCPRIWQFSRERQCQESGIHLHPTSLRDLACRHIRRS